MDAAGGVRCSLNDMLIWAMNWLAPTPSQLAWLSPEQRQKEWTGYTPMPISARQHAWDGTLFYSYGYGWRIADADGQMTVSHTGTLSGMYSAVTLLPFRKSGYVFLIDADADDARTVLNEVLTKRFTAPQNARSVASYADELARKSSGNALRAFPIRPSAGLRRPAISSIDSACGAIHGSARHESVRGEERFLRLAEITEALRTSHAGRRTLPGALGKRQLRGMVAFPETG